MDFARCSGLYEKIPPAPGTNWIAGFVEFCPLRNRKKINPLIFVHSVWKKKLWVLIIAAEKVYSTLLKVNVKKLPISHFQFPIPHFSFPIPRFSNIPLERDKGHTIQNRMVKDSKLLQTRQVFRKQFWKRKFGVHFPSIPHNTFMLSYSPSVPIICILFLNFAHFVMQASVF